MSLWTGAVSTDWGTAGNWAVGGTGIGVPSATVDAIFTGTPIRNCTTGTVARACLALNTTGYLGTLEIGSSTAGYIRVYGNITLGSTAGHITGLSYMGIEGATCALDVAAGFTVPYLAFGTASGGPLSSTITLTRSFVVTALFKAGSAGSTATVTAGSAMSIDVTNGSVLASGTNASTTLNANVTLKLFGTTSYGNNFNVSGSVTAQVGSNISLFGIFFHTGGILNLSAGTVIHGTSSITVFNITSLNMGSNSFYNFVSGIGNTITMLSAINIVNNFSVTANGATNLNGAFDITVGGNLVTGTGSLNNTTAGRKLTLTGASTGVSTVTTYNSSTVQLEIDCGSNGFALTGNLIVRSLNYLATNLGSFTTTGGVLNYINSLSINMNNSTNSWSTISNVTAGGAILTLLSDVYCETFGRVLNSDVINGVGYFIYASGNTGLIGNVSGTAGIRFVGSSSATWNQTAGTVNSMASIVFAKTGSATVSIPNSFTKALGTIKWTSGAVSHAGTLTLGATVTMDTTSVVAWNNITTTAGVTTTINSLLSITGTLLLSGTTTFTGTAGWTCGTLSCSVPGCIITLQQAITYTTTTNAIMLGTNASKILMRSNDLTIPYVLAKWTLTNTPAAQSMVYVSATAVDSSEGMTIWSFGGVIDSSTINWGLGASQGTKVFTYVS
jgi:hypothetical protein